MTQITDKEKKIVVQKLQKYEVIDYLLNLNTDEQITILKVLCNDLELTDIQEAKKLLKCSYNGVQYKKETIVISNKKFAVLK